MNFSTVSRVQQTIRAGDPVDRVRQENRVKVTDMANCVPPLTRDEAKKIGIKINTNFGSMMILLAHARRQYLTAFWSHQHLFKVKMPFAPKETQSEWEAFVTEQINKPMRESETYFNQHDYRWASVVTHGVGPMIWYDQDNWENEFVAMSDLRVATDTTTDFKNLGWFAIRHLYTPFELLSKAFDDKPNNHWDKKAVASILKNYKEVNYVDATTHYNFETSVEKAAELVKQDGGYYSSDAMPVIPLWHFYFEDETENNQKGWFLRIVPEQGAVRGPEPQDFLWQSNTPVAIKRDRILQCQFGDLSNDAPFRYPSVRSLGYALIEPEFYDNLTRCRLLQHIHDNFNIWLRTSDPIDKARAQVQEFSNLGVLRTGVSVVPREERHQIDAGLVEMGMAQMRQLKQEASSTYTQQIDTGTRKEQTAFETSVKVQQVNAMLGGLLLKAFKRASFEYREICRRFCNPHSENEDIKKFHKRCQEAGIPRNQLDVDLWDVEPVTPLGMGNPTMAQAASQQLMAIRPAFPPSAQQEILHEAALVITQDPRKAARWAPIGEVEDVTGGEERAAAIFGTLMQGVAVRPVERISAMEQIDALLPMLDGKIGLIQQRDNVGRPDEIMGLHTVVKYIAMLIAQFGMDPNQKDKTKEYGDQLGQLANLIRGLEQRGQQMQERMMRGGGNGEGSATDAVKAKSAARMARIKEKSAMRKAKLTEKLKEMHHVREQRRRDSETFAELGREHERAKVKNQLAPQQEGP